MRYFAYITLLFLFIQNSYSQVQSEEIINKAKQTLKNIVGENVFSHYSLEKDSYCKYRKKSGEIKWVKLNSKTKIKGEFLEAQLCFLFTHPDYNYKMVNRFTYIQFDSLLNLKDEPIVDFIPEFIRKNETSNWLSESRIEQINNATSIKKPKVTTKRLEFDVNTRKNKWVIFNIFYEEKCFSDVELIEIDPVTGNVLVHKEERQTILHCY